MFFYSLEKIRARASLNVCTTVILEEEPEVNLPFLQRLKRSLSFKTVMRSKSVDNFFQRSNSEARLPQDLLTDPPPSPRWRPARPCWVTPAPPPLSPSLPAKPVRPQINHCFQDHVFRKPTTCQHCKNMIVGNSKQALRCKTCKMAAHLWCTSELSQQPCYGKSGAFKRNFSSPLIITDQLSVVKEVRPCQGDHRSRVDPVYAALRYGTSLAQMTRSSFGSTSDSPTRSLEVEELTSAGHHALKQGQTQEAVHCFRGALKAARFPLSTLVSPTSKNKLLRLVPKRIDVQSIHTYVALFKFLPQEHNDLELQPGDRVQVTDDSNEEWWKGKCGDRVGFFPANFVQRVRPGERVWRVVQSSEGNRGRGHMPVRESQVTNNYRAKLGTFPARFTLKAALFLLLHQEE
uniref:SH3 and cysteine-rich domain-containing protein 2 n=1 Tax=Neogobius melanostomus TaxID=47308 RepID=A0A8C6WZ03_9GOBI